jgi:hypothetical protein
VYVERGEEAPISYVGISMPLVLATDDAFLTKMRRAGVRMFYLVGGFDPITKGAFTGTNPRAREKAELAIRRCQEHDIDPYTSFLVGNEEDDEGVFDRMLDFCETVSLEKAEFAIRTPYPGTPTWHDMNDAGRILHRDWSKYNDANVVFRPAQMSPERLERGYLELWRDFYASRRALSKRDHREATIQF